VLIHAPASFAFRSAMVYNASTLWEDDSVMASMQTGADGGLMA
jgi:hypothetical protein